MENRKDKNRIGFFPFGTGYLTRMGSRSNYYPEDRFSDFLNLKDLTNQKIDDYCDKHNLPMVSRSIKDFRSEFKEQHTRIKTIFEAFEDNKLTLNMMLEINKHIRNVYPKLRKLSEDIEDYALYKDESGKKIDNKENILSPEEIITSFVMEGTFTSLWVDLANHILNIGGVLKCPNCGKYEPANPSRKHKKFCSTDCRITYHNTKKKTR